MKLHSPTLLFTITHLNRFCHDGGDDHNGDVDGDDYCDCDEDGSAPSIKIN